VLIGFDSETYLIRPGRLIPPLICTQYAGADTTPDVFYDGFGMDCVVNRRKLAKGPAPAPQSWEWNALVTNDARLPVFERVMADPEIVFVAHNAAFDFAVMGEAYPQLLEPGAIPDGQPGSGLARPGIFDLYDTDRIRDTGIRDMLLAIAGGWFQYDWRTQPVMKTRFRLSDLVQRYFGVDISGTKHAEKDKDGKDIPGTEPWRLRYCELAGVPAAKYPKPAFDYAVEDSEWAVRCFVAQGESPVIGNAGHPLVSEGEAILNGAGNVTDECEQVRAAFGLHLMSAWGIRSEAEASAKFEAHAIEKVAEGNKIALDAGFLRQKEKWFKRGGVCRSCGARAPKDQLSEGSVCPACGHEGKWSKNMAVMKEMIEEAYELQGKMVPPTEKGATSTSRETLVESGNEALMAYAELGVFQKHLTRYVPELQQALVYPLNPRLNVLVRSGRTSGAIQQPPRLGGYRDCWVPRPGYVYCSIDFDIAELKGLAQIHYWWFGHSALGDAINGGEDPHLSLGTEILRMDTGRDWLYSDMKAALKDAQHPDYTLVSGARQMAKAPNFGFPGGLGVDSFIQFAKATYGMIISPEQARDMKQAWLTKWHEMSEYFEVVAQQCANGTGVALHPISGRQRGGCTFTAMCNTYFQGIVADFSKKGMYQINRACYGGAADGRRNPMYGARNVLFIHDENILEIPAGGLLRAAGLDRGKDGKKIVWDKALDWTPEQTTAAADAAAKLMVRIEGEYLPDVEPSASPALMRRWYKGAKEVRDDAGVLWPWAPDGNEMRAPDGQDAMVLDEQEAQDQEEALT
jgi:hypothetical protein